jgi:hypothetical protein
VSSFVLNIKPNPVKKIITIGIANNTAIKRPESVSSAINNREKGMSLQYQIRLEGNIIFQVKDN